MTTNPYLEDGESETEMLMHRAWAEGYRAGQELPPLLIEFAHDMQKALGENWETYQRPVADLALHWPEGKLECAQNPDYARTYMLDAAKSAADLMLLWLQLRRTAHEGHA